MTILDKYKSDCTNFAKKVNKYLIPMYEGGYSTGAIISKKTLLGLNFQISNNGVLPFGNYAIRNKVIKSEHKNTYAVYKDLGANRRLLQLDYSNSYTSTEIVPTKIRGNSAKWVRKNMSYKCFKFSSPYSLYTDMNNNLYCEIIYFCYVYGDYSEGRLDTYFLYNIFRLQDGILLKSIFSDNFYRSIDMWSEKNKRLIIDGEYHSLTPKICSKIGNFFESNKTLKDINRICFLDRDNNKVSINLPDTLMIDGIKLYRV